MDAATLHGDVGKFKARLPDSGMYAKAAADGFAKTLVHALMEQADVLSKPYSGKLMPRYILLSACQAAAGARQTAAPRSR